MESVTTKENKSPDYGDFLPKGSCMYVCKGALLSIQAATWVQGLSRLCVQRVIWTPRTLFFDSLDTQKIMSEFADDDFS